MAPARHSIVLDWDGTLVKSAWPEQTREWMPGAIEAIRRFHAAGHALVVFSARMTPNDPITRQALDPAVVANEVNYVRDMLDSQGLTFVDIWTNPGKPTGAVYIDDKAERYHGRPGSWAALTDKVLTRLGAEEAIFPSFFDLEVATSV